MKLIIFFTLFYSLCSYSSCKEVKKGNLKLNDKDSLCHGKISINDIQKIINELLENYFFKNSNLDLSKIKIEIKEFDSEFEFIKIDPTPLNERGKKILKHILEVNKVVLSCSPSKESLKAALAHELFHIYHYITSSRNSPNLVQFIGSEKYEKSIDKKIINYGLADELLGYRKWQYARLSDAKRKENENLISFHRRINKVLEKHRKTFLTPVEICQLSK